MSLNSAFARLSRLRDKVEAGTYVVEAIPTRPDAYVACSGDGRPALFISASQGSDSPGIRLRNLELRHRTHGALRTAEAQLVSGVYTLVECLSHDARLHRAFLELAAEVLRNHSNWQSTDDLERAFSSLVELFKEVSQPSPNSWLGTWGELFLIHSSPQPEKLLACWHIDPFNVHDFALGNERLECKSTSGHSRVHEFSLGQLEESERTVFVASIVTHETLGGISALTLYDEIRLRLRSPELRLKIDHILMRMLGNNLESASAPKFDYDEARQTLRIFSAGTVPAPMNPFPHSVTSVRFRSDVSQCEEVESNGELLGLIG